MMAMTTRSSMRVNARRVMILLSDLDNRGPVDKFDDCGDVLTVLLSLKGFDGLAHTDDLTHLTIWQDSQVFEG